MNSVNTVDLRIIAKVPGSGGGATIDLEFANKGAQGNGHENVLAGTNGFTGTKILEDAFTGGVGQSEAPREIDLVYKNSLWWKERAVRSGSAIASSPGADGVARGGPAADDNRETLLKVINNKTDGKGRAPQYFNRFHLYSFTTDIGNSPPYNICLLYTSPSPRD